MIERMIERLPALVMLLLAWLAAPAQAAEPPPAGKHPVLLMPMAAEGLLPADRATLEQHLRAAFEHPEIELLTVADHDPCSEDEQQEGEEACLRALARELGAAHLIRAQVLADGRDYMAKFEVFNLDRETPPSTIDASCQICGLAEFEDRLAARAVAARDLVLATPRVGRVQLVGTPTDARVRVDGELRGRLPFSAELPAGKHELVIVADGHFREVLPIETVAGVEQRIEVRLAPKPIPQWQRSVGWTTLGIGVGSLATGTALIGVHGQPAALRCKSGEPGVVDADGDCRWLRSTLGAGVGLTVVGIAAAATGVSLLAIDATRRRAHARAAASNIEVRALVGFNRVGLRIRF